MMYYAVGAIPNHPNIVGFHPIQLTLSRDLKTWKRLGDRKAFIQLSPKRVGVNDTVQICPPTNAVVHDDELWFTYNSMRYCGSYELSEAERQKLDTHYGVIYMAVLRRDRFISLVVG